MEAAEQRDKSNKPSVRKITAMTHISGYDLPNLNEHWGELELIIGVGLNAVARAEIKDAIIIYIEYILSQENGSFRFKSINRRSKGHSKEKMTPLAKLEKSMLNATEAWIEANQDEKTAILLIDADAKVRLLNEDRLGLIQVMNAFDRVSKLLHLHLSDLKAEAVQVGMHKKLLPPMIPFIRKLADIVERCGGKVSKTYPAYENQKLSDFAIFVAHLLAIAREKLPAELQYQPTTEAFAKIIQRALAEE